MGRVGVTPGQDFIGLVKTIADLARLVFRGIAFYPGHLRKSGDEMDAGLARLNSNLAAIKAEIARAGFETEVVSGGSTPTLYQSHLVPECNEVRPGTYIFNDRNTVAGGACRIEDCAASILTTVVSTCVSGQAIVDGGSKTFSSDPFLVPESGGFGFLPQAPEVMFTKMSEEHGFLDIRTAGRNFHVGDKLRIIPNHICTAVNLHECCFGVRGELAESGWSVEGRGKLQ